MNANIILSPDWMSACSVTPSNNEPGLEDPSLSVIASLPAGNYWSPNKGMGVTYPMCH